MSYAEACLNIVNISATICNQIQEDNPFHNLNCSIWELNYFPCRPYDCDCNHTFRRRLLSQQTVATIFVEYLDETEPTVVVNFTWVEYFIVRNRRSLSPSPTSTESPNLGLIAGVAAAGLVVVGGVVAIIVYGLPGGTPPKPKPTADLKIKFETLKRKV